MVVNKITKKGIYLDLTIGQLYLPNLHDWPTLPSNFSVQGANELT
jgi:hypothetical protein